MAFTEEVEAQIRENEEKTQLLESQMRCVNRTIAIINIYVEKILATRNVSDFYYNNWNDAQDALHCLNRIKERYARELSKMYSLIDLYEYELSR